MEFLVTAKSNVIYGNKNLQKATDMINKLGDGIKRNWFAIAYIVAEIDKQESYKDDGFNTVHEWVESAFGIKKSASYSLLTIGKEYTEKITDKNGKCIGYRTNLITDGDADFSKTQVEKMLPIGHDDARQLVDEGTITPDMTAKEISAVIKSYLRKYDTADEAGEETEQGEPETEDTEVKTIRVTDDDGNVYDIPEAVLTLYRV